MENANFKMNIGQTSNEVIEKVDIENNQIYLNQINKGREYTIEMPLKINNESEFDLNNFVKENSIKLQGEFITEEAKTVKVDKEIKLKIGWTNEANLNLSQEISNVIETETEKVVQVKIKTNVENNALPVKETKLDVKVPEINNTLPEKVIVYANTSKATNGDDGQAFSDQNYNYDKENGTLQITVNNNQDENNKIKWEKNAEDEYIVTYVYKMQNTADIAENAVATENEVTTENEVENQKTINQKINAEVKLYSSEEKTITATSEEQLDITQKGQTIITNVATSNTKEINKGYMYTNTTYPTTYNVKWEESVGYTDIVDEIIVEQGSEKFLNEALEETDSQTNTQYISTKISKENFNKILGEEGNIKIYNAEGTQIATIDKNMQADEEGNYIVNYDQDINYIKIQTSKPQKEGKLEIEHTKQIKAKTNYTIDQIKNFKTMQAQVVMLKYDNDQLAYKHTYKTNIAMQEPSTQIESYINKTNLSTVNTNNDVQINVILKNNKVEYDLYKNPVVEIELPSYVEDMQINQVELLNDEEMKIKDRNVETMQNGNKLLKIELEGEQTKYNTDELTEGAIIAINLNLTLNKFTPNKQDTIKVYVSNQKATAYENEEIGKAYKEIAINYVAPTGMVTVNKIINGTSEAMSLSGKQEDVEIKAGETAKTMTVDMTVINNTNSNTENVSILGKVPTANNTQIGTNQSLGSTFTANMASQIIAKTQINSENMKVYYTKNENATKDVNDNNNGWTEDASIINEAKAYLIVLNGYKFEKGATIEFSYDVTVPGDLKHGEKTYETYAVYYNLEGINTQEVAEATKTGIKTPEGADLKVTLSSNVEGQKVQEGQIIKYTVTVENVGNVKAENIAIKSYIPNEAVYVEKNSTGVYKEDNSKLFVSNNIFSLNVNEKKSYEFELKIKRISDVKYFMEEEELETYVPEIWMRATVTNKVNEEIQSFNSNVLYNEITEGYLSLELSSDKTGELSEESELTYNIRVSNINEKEKTNIIVTSKIPDGTEFIEATENGQYNKNKNEVTWNIGSIEKSIKILTLKVKINNLEDNVYDKQIVNQVSATCNETDETCYSNQLTNKVTKVGVSIIQTSNIESEKISVGDEITYNYMLTNIGGRYINSLQIEAYKSEYIKIENIKCIINGTEKNVGYSLDNTKSVEISVNSLNKGESAKIEIKGTVLDTNTEEDVEISSYAKIVSGLKGEIESNHIKHIIEGKSSSIGGSGNGTGNATNRTYKISGNVWLDNNADGERLNTENRLSNVRVILINKDSNQLLQEVYTDNNGNYTFSNIEKGKYNVVFIYNDQVYTVTTYQKEGVAESANSDAMQVNVELDGLVVVGAITDVITIENSNIYNIDLGLVQKQKFDLKLAKEISNITVQNKQGTKQYNYKDGTTMTKVDINPNYVNGSTVVITYKIKVSNEGDIPGYAKNIVDYIADDVKFSSELNSSWYQASDGNLYTTALANSVINPGETKEITLIVTKQMTDENIGLVVNTAEIAESYNDQAIQDTDSTPANKVQSEDDYGVANIYLSIQVELQHI